MKTWSIKLSDNHLDPNCADSSDMKRRLFRVEALTDCVDYHTGQMLSRATVATLCEQRDCKVSIVSAKD